MSSHPAPTPSWVPARRSVVAWVVYDLANTIFALGVGSLYFASWLTDSGWPDAALSIAIAVAMTVVIVLSPWIGARSDHRGRRVVYLIPMTLLAVVPTFFIASVGLFPSLLLFIAALIGFNLGGVVYDSLLPDVSTEENRGRISGIGVGVGYVGSFFAVAIGMLLLDRFGYAAVFRSIAVAFLVLATPAFVFIRERPRPRGTGPPPPLREGLQRLIAAWRRAGTYPGVVPFLLGRFFYTDAINTLIGGFLTIFVIQELDFSDTEVQVLLLIAIVFAIAGGLVGGTAVDRVGPRRVLHAVLYLWAIAIALGVLAAAADLRSIAWAVGGMGGVALGSTWAADRVYMSRISPPRHLGEFYGLYATVGRFATVLGPLVWAFIVNVIDLPRSVAMLALIGFIAIARGFLGRVDDRPREWGREDVGPAPPGGSTRSQAGSDA